VPEVLHRVFRDHAGCLVRGTVPITAPSDPTNHMSCAAFLTSRLEAPTFGLVQSYDGAGISGGLLHNIAVMPRSLEQGSLWTLVRRILDDGPATPSRTALVQALADMGWEISVDGKVRDARGQVVGGRVLRNWIAPPEGVVPKTGPNWEQAAKVALLFHNLLADPTSFRAQERYSIEWLCAGNKAAELDVYSKYTRYVVDSAVGIPVAQLPPAIHTAMCVYHSFSVNGPAPAAQALATAKRRMTEDPSLFAKFLIRLLGTSDFGKWHDEHGTSPPSNRYDSTRIAVGKYPQWFPMGAELMPRDL